MKTGWVHARLVLALAVVAAASCTVTGTEDEEKTSAELGAEVCTKVREAPCGTAELEAECLEELEEDLADAPREGCEPELHAYLSCAAASAVECITLDTVPPRTYPTISDSRCVELQSEFHECVTWVSGICGISAGTDSTGLPTCSLHCADFSSVCTGESLNGPVSCVCDSGPEQGTTFDAADCGEDLGYQTGHTCGYPPIDDDGEGDDSGDGGGY